MSDVNFKGGYREIAYRYELLDRNFNVVGDITDRVGNCTIEHNSFTPVNRTAKFNLKEYTGEAPATIKGNYENQYWSSSIPNSKWSTIDCWLNDNFISFPKYQQYSGANNEFRETGSKAAPGGGSLPAVGWDAERIGTRVTYSYYNNLGFLNTTSYPSGLQVISKLDPNSDQVLIKSQVSTNVANKRVYFCGYFASDVHTKPDVFVQFSGGNNPVELIQVPSGNITTMNIASGTASRAWKWFEGYYDMVVHGGYTNARMAIGISSAGPQGSMYIDTFYFDFNRSTPFRFRADATLEIDISIADALNQPNNFVTSLCKLTPTIEEGWYNTSEVILPTVKFEWRVSVNGGSTWTSWTDGSLFLFQDARNTKIQLRFTCESYTQMFKPKVKWWILNTGALTNMINPNKDMIDFANHRLKPYLQIKNSSGNWQEHPLGVFLMSSPKRADKDKSIYKEIEAYDQLTILSQAKLMYPLCLYPPRDNPSLAGTGQKGGWAKAAKDLLLGVYPITGYGGRPGLTPGQIWNSSYVNIPDDVYNLPSKSRGRNFKMGETWLAVINQLLNAAGYTPIFCNSNGVLTSIPYVSPDQKPVKHTYIDDETSIIFQEASEELDTFEVANSWVAYQPADQNGIELSGRYTNNNQGHPSSVPSLGRMITDYRDVTGMEGQAEIDRYVYRLAYEASQVYGQINFTTALDPNHEEADIVYLRYQDLGIDGKFVETAWSMELSDDPHMTHRLRRIVSI